MTATSLLITGRDPKSQFEERPNARRHVHLDFLLRFVAIGPGVFSPGRFLTKLDFGDSLGQGQEKQKVDHNQKCDNTGIPSKGMSVSNTLRSGAGVSQ